MWSPCAHLVSRWSCPVAHSSTEQHQCQCYLQRLHPERLSKPTVYEADLDTPLAQPIRTPAEAFVRRLGWDNLKLDPEHLEERCIDALRQMGADYQIIGSFVRDLNHRNHSATCCVHSGAGSPGLDLKQIPSQLYACPICYCRTSTPRVNALDG